MKLSGRITRNPCVNAKTIFTSIRENEDAVPIQLVVFKNHRPQMLCDLVSSLTIDDTVTVEGRIERNPLNDEVQIVVDNLERDLEKVTLPQEF